MRSLVFAVVLLPTVALADVSGPALVTDADTINIQGQELSFYGIDALEITQSCSIDGENWACGWDPADRLEEFIDQREVVCTATGALSLHGR